MELLHQSINATVIFARLLSGAEAVLRLRSLRASGDFKDYWRYHEKMEQERNHISRYDNGLPPLKANGAKKARPKGHLRLVKG
jgi:hypothetical protein